MNDRLFVDAWGWLKILSPRESRHEEVSEYFQGFVGQGGAAFTTDYVLDETLTLLFKRLLFERAYENYETIIRAEDEGYLDIVWVGRERFERAFRLRRRYSDKPDISFTDLTSMVVMQELDLRDVLTGDEHFEYVGLGFRRQP